MNKMNPTLAEKIEEKPISDTMIAKLIVIARRIREAEKEEKELTEKILKESTEDERPIH